MGGCLLACTVAVRLGVRITRLGAAPRKFLVGVVEEAILLQNAAHSTRAMFEVLRVDSTLWHYSAARGSRGCTGLHAVGQSLFLHATLQSVC